MNLPCYGVLETISDSAVVSGINWGLSPFRPFRVCIHECRGILCSRKHWVVAVTVPKQWCVEPSRAVC